ncbi:MAG: UvrB/UvrC motif-containing protein [Pseudomonadota bacterium]
MPDSIQVLRSKMRKAADELDFEEARRLRDRINLMLGGASAHDAKIADTAGLTRQQPGKMGLGTGQPRRRPPADWKRPRKPDLRTRDRG